jgi:hypothetical protein
MTAGIEYAAASKAYGVREARIIQLRQATVAIQFRIRPREVVRIELEGLGPQGSAERVGGDS